MWTWTKQGTPDKLAATLTVIETAPISNTLSDTPSDEEQNQFLTVRDLVVNKIQTYKLPDGCNALDVKISGIVTPVLFDVKVKMVPINLAI